MSVAARAALPRPALTAPAAFAAHSLACHSGGLSSFARLAAHATLDCPANTPRVDSPTDTPRIGGGRLPRV